MVIVPDATPATMGILNTMAVGMSGAVTSATKVATAVVETSARTMRVPGPGPGSTESPQAPRTKTDASANDGMLNREQDIENASSRATSTMSCSVPPRPCTPYARVTAGL